MSTILEFCVFLMSTFVEFHMIPMPITLEVYLVTLNILVKFEDVSTSSRHLHDKKVECVKFHFVKQTSSFMQHEHTRCNRFEKLAFNCDEVEFLRLSNSKSPF